MSGFEHNYGLTSYIVPGPKSAKTRLMRRRENDDVVGHNCYPPGNLTTLISIAEK
jgi:hypothetical protein